jgi:Mrp family chromosome partitioning ATPase
MTALDQAFIKAFTQQGTFPPAVLPPPVLPAAKPCPAGQPDAGQSAAPPRTEEPSGELRSKAEDRAGLKRRGASHAPSAAIRQPPLASPRGTAASSSAGPGGVWAALERSPKAITNLRKPDAPPEHLRPAPAADTEPSTPTVAEPAAPASAPRVQASAPRIAEPLSKSLAAWSLPPSVDERTRSAVSLPVDGTQFAERDPEPLPVIPPAPVLSAPVLQPFKSGWQVEQFTWPRLCRRLIAWAAGELDRLADALLAASTQGQKVLAMAGCRRGEGATTLLLCAARRLAERGIKLVLVDADLAEPRLAPRLGVQPQFGWDETDEQGRSLDQAIVEATANNLALLPAREPSGDSSRPTADLDQLPACLSILKDHYDMVLVDLGPLEESGEARRDMGRLARLVDGVVLVCNHRITSAGHLAACQEELVAAGTAVAGIVENFVAED